MQYNTCCIVVSTCCHFVMTTGSLQVKVPRPPSLQYAAQHIPPHPPFCHLRGSDRPSLPNRRPCLCSASLAWTGIRNPPFPFPPLLPTSPPAPRTGLSLTLGACCAAAKAFLPPPMRPPGMLPSGPGPSPTDTKSTGSIRPPPPPPIADSAPSAPPACCVGLQGRAYVTACCVVLRDVYCWVVVKVKVGREHERPGKEQEQQLCVLLSPG